MPDLMVDDLTAGYGAMPVIHDVSLTAPAGKLTAIVGPNGSGKTSLLHSVLALLSIHRGSITFADRPVLSMTPRQRARLIALVAQESRSSLPLSVEEIVMLGRYPHLRRWQSEGNHDLDIVKRSLQRVDALSLSDRIFPELSGGERQRVIIARALAQMPELLLMDEPTAHLDVGHQHAVMALARDLAVTDGLAVVCVLHDLNLAAAYGDVLIVLKDGRIAGSGEPADVITADMMQDVYGVSSLVRSDPVSGRPYVFTTRAQRQAATGIKIHVVGGGGSAGDILDALYWRGADVTLGAVNIGDHDWVRARELGFSTIDAPPFSPVTEDLKQQAVETMLCATGIIIAPVPLGPGNIDNLAAVATALSMKDKPVAMVAGAAIESRDWTGGVAHDIYYRLQEHGATWVESPQELGAWLDMVTARAKT